MPRRSPTAAEAGAASDSPDRRNPSEEKIERTAFSMILARLARRDHTEAELRQALARKDLPAAAAQAALDRARKEGLVNDLRLAQSLARAAARSGKKGPRRLLATLRRKGLPGASAEAAVREAFTDSAEGRANLAKFAGRLLDRARGSTLKDRRIKVVRSLLGRGFGLSEAKEALRLAENAEDD